MRFIDLGTIGYREAEAIQKRAVEEVILGGRERVFLLEHDPVVTLGRQAGMDNLLLSEEELSARGVELVRAARGGNITCHYPGQVVAYPIVRVEKRPGGIKRYFHDLEEAVRAAAARFGVETYRVEGRTGVWTKKGKLAAMGVAVRRWVAWHGLALNVARNRELFDCIVPCGINNARTTSLEEESGQTIPISDVKHALAQELERHLTHPPVAADQAAQ